MKTLINNIWNTFRNANRYFVIVMFLIGLPLLVFGVSQVRQLLTRAAGGPVTVSFLPIEAGLPPNTNFDIMLSSGSTNVAFARIVFTFDRTKVQLQNEIQITGPLTTVVEKTPKDTANAQGKVILVLALPPNTPYPSGVFEIADFILGTVTTSQTTGQLIYTTSDMQIVQQSGEAMVITAENASLNLNNPNPSPTLPGATATNPPATPTLPSGSTPTVTPKGPTVIPTVSPTIVPTSTTAPTVTPTRTPTPSPTPTQTPTPTPTRVPTATPTAIPTTAPTPTAVPTATPVPGNTSISMTLLLHGLGRGGDNANPSSNGNLNPLRQQRNVTVEVFNASGQSVSSPQGTVSYNSTDGNFQNTFSLGTLPTGQYTLKVSTPQFLKKSIPGFFTITQGQTTLIPAVTLVTGDTNVDNRLSILDYNVIIDCYEGSSGPRDCTDPVKKQHADLTDDGSVNLHDFNLFLREMSVQPGE